MWAPKDQVEKDEAKDFETGPLSILMQSVKQNTQVKVKQSLYWTIDFLTTL